MRTDLQPVRDGDQISVDLKLLTARRLDIIHDRVRAINRLRATMLEYFPALERAFDYSTSKAALTLLSTYQTPGALRRMGVTRLAAWLKARGCRNSATVAQKAIDAAREQETTLRTEIVAATLVSRLAAVITAIDADLVDLEKTSPPGSASTRTLRSWKACQDSGPSSPPRSLPTLEATCAASKARTGLQALPASHQLPETPAASAATTTDPADSTDGCYELAISQHYQA